ncbi:Ig-like domain-containing protein [Treponema sp. R6D11]
MKIIKNDIFAAVSAFSIIFFLFLAGCSKGGKGGGSSGGVDTTPPTVTGVTPSGAGISAGGNVVITFSEAMDPTPGTVQLNDRPALSGGSWSSEKVYTIPFSGLAPGLICTVNICDFKDKAGNAMTADDSGVFTTKALKAGMYKKAPEALTADDEPDPAFDKNRARETYAAALNYITANAGVYTLAVDGDISAAPVCGLNSGRTLYLLGIGGGRTIALSTDGSIFIVNSNAALFLCDNIRLKGFAANTKALVYVNGGGLTMKNGSAISGNTNLSSEENEPGGGGVLLNGGSFTIEGGEVSGNNAKDGGGVCVKGAAARFSMSGGSVKDNTVNSNNGGGGVHIADGTFTMTGGEVKGNKNSNSSGGGGGVYVNGGAFTMSNGAIKENRAGWLGGGVFVWNGYFVMTGGEISGNAGSGGGGVLLYAKGAFTMSNGVIKGNSTGEGGYGGGVFIFGGSFIMTGGATVSGNRAGSGGGVSLNEGTFRIAGGTIYGSNAAANLKNISSGQGAAVYVSGVVTAERGTFSGGVFVPLSSDVLAIRENTLKVANGALQ